MKKIRTGFYIILFIIITLMMIVCIYELLFNKSLFYLIIGVVCYIFQNLVISLIYNEGDKLNRIKKCPKCNSKGIIKKVGDYKQYYIIECKDCKYSPFNLNEGQISENKAIKIWNERIK